MKWQQQRALVVVVCVCVWRVCVCVVCNKEGVDVRVLHRKQASSVCAVCVQCVCTPYRMHCVYVLCTGVRYRECLQNNVYDIGPCCLDL